MGLLFHGTPTIFRSAVLTSSWTVESLSESVKHFLAKGIKFESSEGGSLQSAE